MLSKQVEFCNPGAALGRLHHSVFLQETVSSLKERACRMFDLDTNKVEIWDFFHRSKYATLEDKLEATLEEARVLEGQGILLDDKVSVAA